MMCAACANGTLVELSGNEPHSMEHGAAISVLLIEDHDDYRQSMATLLNTSGRFTCRAYSDGESGLTALGSERSTVVLMDINLPGMNGIQCTRAIKERWPEVQVMMCTVYEDDEKIFDALKAGATGYVIKRAPIEELFDAIEQLAQGGSPMSATIARKVVGSFQVRTSVNGEKLSEREVEVLDHLSKGLRIKEIADRMKLSTNTVRTHVRHIYEKLQVQSRTEALNKMRYPRG
jgi:DNA-binding NarL/FixJ family response regulator